jgi:hypothetical protein
VNLDEQIRYYEEKVRLGEKTYSKASPGMKEHVYASVVFPYKAILRSVRLKAGIPICWGNVECLAYPSSKCAAGQHEACKEHEQSCFLCVPTA